MIYIFNLVLRPPFKSLSQQVDAMNTLIDPYQQYIQRILSHPNNNNEEEESLQPKRPYTLHPQQVSIYLSIYPFSILPYISLKVYTLYINISTGKRNLWFSILQVLLQSRILCFPLLYQIGYPQQAETDGEIMGRSLLR